MAQIDVNPRGFAEHRGARFLGIVEQTMADSVDQSKRQKIPLTTQSWQWARGRPSLLDYRVALGYS